MLTGFLIFLAAFAAGGWIGSIRGRRRLARKLERAAVEWRVMWSKADLRETEARLHKATSAILRCRARYLAGKVAEQAKENLALTERLDTERADGYAAGRSEAAWELDQAHRQQLALADRVAQQSQLLALAAEGKADSERRLGYLFPKGLETPPFIGGAYEGPVRDFNGKVEDPLSPTWAKQPAEGD